MRRWPQWILAHKKGVVLIFLLVTAGGGTLAPQVQFDFNFQEYFPENDPVRDAYRRMLQDFPGEASEIVVVVRDSSLFSQPGMAALRRLTAELETAPWSKKVLGPLNVPAEVFGRHRMVYARVREGGDFAPNVYALLRTRMAEHPLLKNQLVFEEGRIVVIRVTLQPAYADDTGRERVREALLGQLEPYNPTFSEIFYTGVSGIRADFAQVLKQEQRKLFPLVLLVLLLALYLALGRSWLLLLPFVTSTMALVWTLGLMALGKAAFTILSSATPLLILIIGISDSMHIFYHLRGEIASGVEREEAIVNTFCHLGAACFLTSTTTTIGFGALVLTNLPVLHDFGLYTGLGILLNFLVMMGLLPILLRALPVSSIRFRAVSWIRARSRNLVEWLVASLTRSKQWLFVSAIVVMVTAIGCLFLYEETRVYQGLKTRSTLSEKIQKSEAYIGGLLPFGVMLQVGEGVPLLSETSLQRLQTIQAYLNAQTEIIGSTFSLVNVADWLREAEPSPPGMQAPQASSPLLFPLLQQRLVMLQEWAPDLLSSIMNTKKGVLLIRCRLRDVGSRKFRRFLNDLQGVLESTGASDAWMVAGLPYLSLRLSEKVITYIITTISLTIGLIFIGFLLWFQSLRVALIGIIPNLLPLLSILGFLGWTGIALQPSVVVVFSVVYGIAVNDTIHFLSRFARVRQRDGRVIEITVRRTAAPMISSSVVLVLGFSVLLFSEFLGLLYLGLLLVVGILAALFGDLLLLPLLLRYRHR